MLHPSYTELMEKINKEGEQVRGIPEAAAKV